MKVAASGHRLHALSLAHSALPGNHLSVFTGKWENVFDILILEETQERSPCGWTQDSKDPQHVCSWGGCDKFSCDQWFDS